MAARPQRTLGWSAAVFLGVIACDAGNPRRAEAARVAPTTLRVSILGPAQDPRLVPVREALAHWNADAERLGLAVRFDSGTLRGNTVPDATLRAASRGMPWGGPGVLRLRAALSGVSGDVVIVFARMDLISFGVTRGTGRAGVIGLRPADRWPLSLPNTARNVAAHELGHVLGLPHNADSTTLMCGRPAPCRPTAFVSATARFFPLTPAEESRLRDRWR